MITKDTSTTSVQEIHNVLLSAVAPRPIALASTIDKEGRPNLSPFSFYNAFGANPATLVFSPSRRGRDNTTKHTYENLLEVPEVVINAVTFSIVQQTSLASTEYPKGENEFIKAGLTAIPSEHIRPFRVKESPVQFECKVRDIIETGDQGGAGILVICEVLAVHIDENLLDDKGKIDPLKMDLAGRLGGDYYIRTSGDAIFRVEKPLQKLGIGIEKLPKKIKNSKFLTGNDLGKLGNIEHLPANDELELFKKELMLEKKLSTIINRDRKDRMVTNIAKKMLEEGNYTNALKVLMCYL
jgi:flavin reductase (DIM6/NTAB) family NADH-FMN oxidoreductase RutF